MPHSVAIVGLALLSTMLHGPSPGSAAPTAELWVYRHATMSSAALHRARTVVDAVFTPAGLAVSWIDCDQEDAHCRTTMPDRVVVEVLILPVAKHNRPGVCGETAHSPAGRAGIIVFASCVRAVVAELRRGSTDPRLLTVQPADIIGLTIAHELGHVWGLSHTPTGLMMSRFDRGSLLALRSSGTGLTPEQVARMKDGLQERAALQARR